MFAHKSTVISEAEFHIPVNDEKVSGICHVSVGIGIPTDYPANKNIRIKVTVNATMGSTDNPFVDAASLSVFSADCDTLTSEEILTIAQNECIPIALNETAQKIADATESLCGRRIELPLSHS